MGKGAVRALRWTPVVIVGAIAGLVLVSLAEALVSWRGEHGLTVGARVARRRLIGESLILAPLAGLTLFAASRARPTVELAVPWAAVPAALVVFFERF